MENKIKKVRVGLIAGIFLVFLGFVGITVGDFIAGLALLISGLVLIPQIVSWFENKWNLKFTKVNKIIIVVVGLFIFGSSIDSDPNQPTKKAPVQEATSQTQLNSAEEVKSEDNKESIQAETAVQEPQNESLEQLYSVLSVVDGDTVQIEIDGKEETLRLIGINTPETVDPRKPVECFGKEASNKAKELLTGKSVQLEADSTQGERDKYNRLLRYVILGDGTNFNKKMIEDGYAYEYTYNTPYKYQAEFKEAQQKAKEEKQGLWAENSCNGELNFPQTKTETETSQSSSSLTSSSSTTSASVSSDFICSGKRTCGQMNSCEEAYFYLNNCGVSGLDRDKDGIPCETICN